MRKSPKRGAPQLYMIYIYIHVCACMHVRYDDDCDWPLHLVRTKMVWADMCFKLTQAKFGSVKCEAKPVRTKFGSAKYEAQSIRTKFGSAKYEAKSIRTKFGSDQFETHIRPHHFWSAPHPHQIGPAPHPHHTRTNLMVGTSKGCIKLLEFS